MRVLEFNNASVPINAVTNSLSVTSELPNTAFTARFVALILVSCTSSKWGASRGLKCHMTPLVAVGCFFVCLFFSDPVLRPVLELLSRPPKNSYHCQITSLLLVLSIL